MNGHASVAIAVMDKETMYTFCTLLSIGLQAGLAKSGSSR
jgi:hypothetical protein